MEDHIGCTHKVESMNFRVSDTKDIMKCKRAAWTCPKCLERTIAWVARGKTSAWVHLRH